MKPIYKVAACAAILLSVFVSPVTAEDDLSYSEYVAKLRQPVETCEGAPKAIRKTYCLNAISLVRLSRKTFKYDIPEQDIMFDSLEMMAVLHLSQIYLLEGNTRVFCDYSHTGGLLLRDVLVQTDALIASDPEKYERLKSRRKQLDALTDFTNRNKIVCLNERIIFSKR